MRSIIIIVVLSALAACHGAAVLPGDVNMFSSFIREQMLNGFTLEHNEEDLLQNRVTLSKGEARDDLILFYEQLCDVPAVPNHAVQCNVVYHGEPNVKLMRFRTSFSWPSPAEYISSGLSSNVGEVRLVSHPGERINAIVSMFGKVIEA